MLVREISAFPHIRQITPGDPNHTISKIFCCDLLSIAMGRAPKDCAWITVMGNKNTLAVATLVDAACIILAEDITFSEEEIACARKEGIAVFVTDLPIFDTGLMLSKADGL